MRVFGPLLFAVLMAGAALAQEAPPPPIERELAPGSRLIDPRADTLVKKMSDLLASADSLALSAYELFDEVPEHRPRTQLTNRRHIALKRPDRMAGDASGDAINRSFYYDGETLSIFDREHNAYSSVQVPPTIDGALDAVFDETGLVVPLGDFLYDDVHARLMESVQRGVYLGIHDVSGIACHHLSFEQETIDWQLWIDAGNDPLPRKLVIAYKTEDEVPQYAVTITKWNLKADVPDELFRFEPPEDAERLDLRAVVGSGDPEEKNP